MNYKKSLAKILVAVFAAVMVLPFMRCVPVEAFAAGTIPIYSTTYFPDANFQKAVKAYDTNGDNYLSQAERNAVINLHCENMNIYSIKGIEYFPNIQGLWCLNNHISSWDLSANKELVGIWCSHNDFTTLNFKGLDKLEWVYCFNCKLTSINFKDNPNLAYVECNANPDLKYLNLTKNTKLENLFCSECGLTSLNLSNNPMLCELDAQKNKLTSLDLSNNPCLKRLDIWDNENLGDVDISNLKGLEYYNCANNGVTKLDMSNNPQLQLLICGYNEELTYLNVKNNPRLADLRLECDYNLTSLDLSGNPQLYNLYAFGCGGLSSVNISNNPYLIKAYKEGFSKAEPQLGYVTSYTIEYGGSEEYFEDLTHCVVVDNGKSVVTTGGNPKVVSECYINTNDGYTGSETFATRGQAIQLLWEKAGCPVVSGTSRFNDVAGSPYEAAIIWGETYNICFGYPSICADSFCPDELVSREDFALMAHRLALYMGLGTAFDYGRTDWFDDFYAIDYYGWGAFTWAIQFEVLKTSGNKCNPHGRMTVSDLQAGADKIFNLDGAASYSAKVNGNGTPVVAQKVKLYADGNKGNVYTLPASSGNSASVSSAANTIPPLPSVTTSSDVSVCYCTHVQNVGWQDWVFDGEMAGTEGQALRLEGMMINVQSDLDLGVKYKTHVQNIGWQDWVYDGQMSGTSGQALRLEGMMIELTGSDAADYDIYYRVHVQDIGWMGWVKNGEMAGTEGQSKRLEGMQIKIVPKGASPEYITYQVHVEDIGWQGNVNDGLMAGTTGQSKRLEGIKISVTGLDGVGVEYKTHIQDYGWETSWTSNGGFSGTEGQAKRLEAIMIRLTGENAADYDIYYRVHVQNFGWTGWACNGAECGSAGYAYRLEGIEIVVVPAGDPAPGPTTNCFYQA